MLGIIYKMTLKPTGKIYVGQRWDKDVSSFEENYWGSGTIWLSYVKYYKKCYPSTWKNLIKKEVLFSSEACSQRTLDAMEKFFIKKCNSLYCNGLGYNLLPGSAYGKYSVHPYKVKKVKEKMIQKLKGRKIPEEVKEKMRIAATGRKLTEDTKLKISLANKGKVSARKGVKLTEETKNKCSLSHLGKKHNEETKEKISQTLKMKRYGSKGINK